MVGKPHSSGLGKTIWAYAYQIVPPQTADRLRPIQTLLAREHAMAQREARTWGGTVVLEENVTLIMVVSDSPRQNREINKSLEAAIKELQADVLLTTPLAVADEAADGIGVGAGLNTGT